MLTITRIVMLVALSGIVLAQSNQKKSSPSAKQPKSAAQAKPASPSAKPNLSPSEEAIVFRDFRDSLSYALGINVIGTIHKQGLDINPDIFLQAMRDGFDEKEPKLNAEAMTAVFKQFEHSQGAGSDHHSQQETEDVSETKAKGTAFLAENAKKPGVITTASGLQYKVINQGNGPKPMATDNVKVHYKGTLIDGTKFDSSYDRGEPIQFGLNGVIKGWTEGVQLMSVGSKYEFYIPSELAYGDRAIGGVIPGGSTLIFEVELLDIPSAKAPGENK